MGLYYLGITIVLLQIKDETYLDAIPPAVGFFPTPSGIQFEINHTVVTDYERKFEVALRFNYYEANSFLNLYDGFAIEINAT